jgi:hypothetical protein
VYRYDDLTPGVGEIAGRRIVAGNEDPGTVGAPGANGVAPTLVISDHWPALAEARCALALGTWFHASAPSSL